MKTVEKGNNKAVRCFLKYYASKSAANVGTLKELLTTAGYPYWPMWVDKAGEYEDLTEEGAEDWLRYLFTLETKRLNK